MEDLLERLQAALEGRYAIVRELGHGGMALVFLARDVKHDRRVAIKMLRPELAAALGPERFLREITMAAQLRHPHILPLYDSGEAAGLLYYVMPYVEGESLRDRLVRETQLPLEDALEITREVADALSYAHSRDVVHRDIKPENILLGSGHAIVADFGIARAITAAGGEKLTETGIAVGTPSYMSPEQASGEHRVDGRSDVYSLGCVAYEMLVGEPPYRGPTAQAIAARRLTDPVPPLRTVRESVPVRVELAIVKALAKVPADRFATPTQFAGALAAEEVSGQLPAGRTVLLRHWAITASLLGVAVMAAVVVWRSRVGPSATLDPDLLAVPPFETHDPSLEVWREGLVDMLSRNLDGAGPLRTVPMSVVLRRWQGPADRVTAAVLGRRTGAGMAAFGDLVSRGGDSVTLRTTLLDVGTNTTQGEVEVSGEVDRMGDLADSLGRRLLTALGRERPIAAVRRGSLGAGSLPALKAFLRGEQFYRRSAWDSALAYYDQAVTTDSGFVLALYKLGLTLGWRSSQSGRYAEDYGGRAVRLNHGQAPRDSLILAADSNFYAAFSADRFAPLVGLLRRSLELRKEATRLYPGDPEVWYLLGDALYHGDGPFRGTAAEVLVAFDRAIELDSGFGPAFEHTAQLGMQLGGPDLARRYLAAYMKLNPAEDFASNLSFQSQVLDPAQAGTAALARLIDTARAQALNEAFRTTSWWPDSAEMVIRLQRSLVIGRSSFAGVEVLQAPHLMQQRLALILASRGHLREAWHVYRDSVGPGPSGRFWNTAWNPFPELALLQSVPPDTAARVFGQVLDRAARWPPQWHRVGLAWWAARGDTASLRRFLARANEETLHTANQLDSVDIRRLGASAAAFLSLARRDSAAALLSFQGLPDSLCISPLPTCLFERFTQGALEAALGDDRKAAATLDRWVEDAWWVRMATPVIVLARLERAHIAERLGERELAMRYYQFVTDIWRHADPELGPYVWRARAGLAHLTAEPRKP